MGDGIKKDKFKPKDIADSFECRDVFDVHLLDTIISRNEKADRFFREPDVIYSMLGGFSIEKDVDIDDILPVEEVRECKYFPSFKSVRFRI